MKSESPAQVTQERRAGILGAQQGLWQRPDLPICVAYTLGCFMDRWEAGGPRSRRAVVWSFWCAVPLRKLRRLFMLSHLFSRSVLAAVIISTPVALAAQAEFGIKGGASFGSISNKGLLPGNLKDRTGFAAGVSVGVRARVIGLGAEALFAQRGVTSDVALGDERKLNYLDVPVYVKLAIPSPAISPFVYVGPQVSFELNCRDEATDCPSLDRPKTDYAGVIGAGVKLGNEKKFGITGEARYIYGLRDLKPSTVTSDESFKTRSFLILLGILF